MEEQAKKKNYKPVIILLAILLAVSIAALAITLVLQNRAVKKPASVEIPDNVVTSEAIPDSSDVSGNAGNESNSGNDRPVEVKYGSPILLYQNQPGDNVPFQATNMFPGDQETKYFGVKVFYKGAVNVRFHADIRPGGEKLAEVLKVRVRLLNTDETLYEGLMQEMPQAVVHPLQANGSTQSVLYYEITAYLDTQVGNDYMNKDLTADFRWWVEETENLDPPITGDTTRVLPWIILGAGALIALIVVFLLGKRHKEADNNDEQ